MNYKFYFTFYGSAVKNNLFDLSTNRLEDIFNLMVLFEG